LKISLSAIREQDPLKQGLKPHYQALSFTDYEYSRARSIKTRIETTNLVLYFAVLYSRARSIKTRIETMPASQAYECGFLIREQDPLKQGLKQKFSEVAKDDIRFASKIH